MISKLIASRCRHLSSAKLSRRQHRHQQRAAPTAAMGSATFTGPTFFLDGFAQRQWDDAAQTGTVISYDKQAFVDKVHEFYAQGAAPLVDGYAPFCKHVFVPNFVGAKVGIVAIMPDNEHLLRSGYTSRRPDELAVLSRWFPAGSVAVHEARYLDLILYSREQLLKEYEAMPSQDKPDGGALPNAPWGIISIKAQDQDHETPMQPITMLRNALGREEGGSGVALDREAYRRSVEYWNCHAVVQ